MLSWDEAWNLCALTSVARGDELFSFQFWRHPPLYMISGLLFSPLKPGFEYRMEFLSLVLNSSALIALIKLVSHVYGKRIAFFTAVAYLLAPGPVFFDTWVKQDPVVTLFGLLSVYFFFKRRNLAAGMFLGLALLGKETALFYCAALFLMIACQCQVRRFFKNLFAVFCPAFLIAGWWYLLIDRGAAGYLDFFSGHSQEATDFSGSWWSYFAKLFLDLGPACVVLTMVGSLTLITSVFRHSMKGKGRIKSHLSRPRLFPFFLLLPSYIVISLSAGKPFWITISLHPAMALLAGTGWASVVKLIRLLPGDNKNKFIRKAGLISLAVAPAIAMAMTLSGFHYEQCYKKYSPEYQSGLGVSYEILELVNKNVKDNEKLLILPMLYRNGPAMPDPVFHWGLKVSPRILYNGNINIDYQEFEEIIIKHRIDWILMSPVDGSSQLDVLEKLTTRIQPAGYLFSRGVLLNVSPLWSHSQLKN